MASEKVLINIDTTRNLSYIKMAGKKSQLTSILVRETLVASTWQEKWALLTSTQRKTFVTCIRQGKHSLLTLAIPRVGLS